MENSEESIWLKNVLTCAEGYEALAVEQFTQRLISLARTRLPQRLQRRVDPEDIVQSAFNSFFQRHQDNQFQLENSSDLWRLLAAITYHKVVRALEFHGRQQRDYSRDHDLNQAGPGETSHQISLDDKSASVSTIAVMAELLEQILDRLPEAYRKILQLRLDNYSIDEIASQTNMSSRTVDRALERARKIATDILTEDEDGPCQAEI